MYGRKRAEPEWASGWVNEWTEIEMSISVGNVNDTAMMATPAADDTYCGFHKLLNA